MKRILAIGLVTVSAMAAGGCGSSSSKTLDVANAQSTLQKAFTQNHVPTRPGEVHAAAVCFVKTLRSQGITTASGADSHATAVHNAAVSCVSAELHK